MGYLTPSGYDVAVNYNGPKPTITVLCGSTRFSEAFRQANLRLTVQGHIVLSIGCDTKADKDLDLAATAADGRTLDQIKHDLDELHKRKIDLADQVYVLNVGGYLGQSTRSEIVYAIEHGKPVTYLEPDSAPIAGDEHNGWELVAYRIPGNTADAIVRLYRGGELVRESTYPAYRVWTLLAHWRESDEINGRPLTGSTVDGLAEATTERAPCSIQPCDACAEDGLTPTPAVGATSA